MAEEEITSPLNITFLIGCTGCGKGSLGRELAERVGAEIISVDSMKVYQGMDIGTAKPSHAQRQRVPHHMIDVVQPTESFSVAQYVASADEAIQAISKRNAPVLVVGGTPLYVKALSEGLFDGPGADQSVRDRIMEEGDRIGWDILYKRLESVDAQAASRIHPNDQRRIVRALEIYELTGTPISVLQTQWDRRSDRYQCRFIGLRRGKEDQNARTNSRVRRMIEQGLVDEVRTLLAEHGKLGTPASQALGYAEIIRCLDGQLSLEEAVELIKINTRRLAKAQRTWFKRFQSAHWIDLEPDSDVRTLADEISAWRGFSWSA